MIYTVMIDVIDDVLYLGRAGVLPTRTHHSLQFPGVNCTVAIVITGVKSVTYFWKKKKKFLIFLYDAHISKFCNYIFIVLLVVIWLLRTQILPSLNFKYKSIVSALHWLHKCLLLAHTNLSFNWGFSDPLYLLWTWN